MEARQLSFFDATRPPIPSDPHVDAQDLPRLTGQNAVILARLREGPATNDELIGLSRKYTSRISDLRAAGYTITCRRLRGGLTEYSLER